MMNLTPLPRFLISTHYTRYDYTLFALNFAALVLVLFPKLPVVRVPAISLGAGLIILQLHRLRFQFLPSVTNTDVVPTPVPSRPATPRLSDEKALPT